MAGDEFTSPAGESPEGAPGGSWEELLGRVEGPPVPDGDATVEPHTPTEAGSGDTRGGVSASRRKGKSSSLRARLLVGAALLVLIAALARVLLPALSGSDSQPRPAADRTDIERRLRPDRAHRAGAEAGSTPRAGAEEHARGRRRPGKRGRHEPTRPEPVPDPNRPPPPAPPDPAAVDTPPIPPSEAPPTSPGSSEPALGSGEPAPPGTGGPSRANPRDGSHSSPEFGL